MAAEEEGEGTGGVVGWSGGAREGEREVGDERRLGGGLIRAQPRGAVGGAHGHGPWRCQRPKGRSGAFLGCSCSWSRPRGEERGSRVSSRRSRTSAATGGRERCSGTRVRGRRREKEEGADRRACPGHRGGLGDTRGDHKVVGFLGQDAARVRERIVARSRAPIWPAWPCPHNV